MKRRAMLISVVAMLLLPLVAFSGCKGLSGDGDPSSATNYTVTFQTNGGSAIEPMTSSVLESAPATTKANHLFAGWYCDEALTTAATFPLTLGADTTLYAKWLKSQDTMQCEDATIKCWEGSNASASWSVTPGGFDWDGLEKLGVSVVHIKVTYHVKYSKDYNVPFDVGYLGAPKYEAMLLKTAGSGEVLKNLTTTTDAKEREISISLRISDIKTEQINLKFFTDNIQNKIIFENITVEYKCQ